MKDSKIVVNGHGWNRAAALRILVGPVALLTVALASGGGSQGVHAAGAGHVAVRSHGTQWGGNGTQWGGNGSQWGGNGSQWGGN